MLIIDELIAVIRSDIKKTKTHIVFATLGIENCRCFTGSFFLPRDQQNKEINNKHTDYEGLAYLGELPLAWAACCGNQTVYNLLIDAGASPDVQDSFGNMILHMVVVCDKLVRIFKIFFSHFYVRPLDEGDPKTGQKDLC